ncbi:MAG: hypothetical protein PVF56_18855 [Desulfobacterales bacterium]
MIAYSVFMYRNGKGAYEKLQLLIKIPFVLIMVTFGFFLEFLINLPLIVICELDTRLRKKI